jgi:hypothetical protein
MKHILNNLTDKEKQAILEQHKGGMKVMTESFSKLIKATLGDAKPLVSEQSTDMATDLSPKYTHFADKGIDSPGIQKFMSNPTDNTISNGLLNELRNDPYGKGKIVIIFNGEKFKEPGAFMFKIQTDFKAGKCYKITDYEYNNRVILNTQITITADGVECKKQKPNPTPGPGPKPNPIPPTPKKFCKHKISDPFERGDYSKGSLEGFQEFCSRMGKNVWVKEYSDGTTVPCTSKDIDGKWGCCSQTCYVKTRKKVGPPPSSSTVNRTNEI